MALDTENPLAPSLALTANERCDRCGAQAYIRAAFAVSDLLFCAHHGRKHLSVLIEQALFIEDHTAMINSKPSPAAY